MMSLQLIHRDNDLWMRSKKNVFSETDNAIFQRKLCEPTSVTVKLLENVVIPFQKKNELLFVLAFINLTIAF